MKVLKRAEENEQLWKTIASCTGYGWYQTGTPCGSLLEVNATDIKKRSHKDVSGITDVYYGFICPVCGCFTEISSSSIPSNVKSNARVYANS